MAKKDKWAGYSPAIKVKQSRKEDAPKLTKRERKVERMHLRNKRRAAYLSAVRPVCKLDKRAMELGVYDEEFHAMPRHERSSIVHQAAKGAA